MTVQAQDEGLSIKPLAVVQQFIEVAAAGSWDPVAEDVFKFDEPGQVTADLGLGPFGVFADLALAEADFISR